MQLYLYRTGAREALMTIDNAASYTDRQITAEDGTVYGPFSGDIEISSLPDCSESLRAKWRTDHPSADPQALGATVYISRLALIGEAADTDDKRLRAAALYPAWTPGSYAPGAHYNAGGQTWECFQAYDSAVYPDIRPGEAAWHTFNRPLHGTTPETARPWVKPRHGTTDIYRPGEHMVWTDGSVYRCLRDTDFSPEEFSADWEIVSGLDTGGEVEP